MKSVHIASAAVLAVLVGAIALGQNVAAQTPASQSQPSSQTATATQGAACSPAKVVQQSICGDGIVVSKLSNGLTLIVKAHRAAPVVNVRCYVHTGSMYEREWLGSGLSHLVEHLVAMGDEGSDKTDLKKLARSVSRIGGTFNASTTLDYTNYYVSAAAGKSLEAVDIVSQWMVDPQITEADFQREHGVVQRELELGKDRPEWLLYYANMETLYSGHPAGIPVIGLAAPLSQLKFSDVLEYHKRMYVPQNMVFCVVGDVDVQAVIQRVCQNFAVCNEGRAVDLHLGEVQPVTRTIRKICPLPKMKECIEMVSFQTNEPMAEDEVATDMLSEILGGGPNSRLYEKLIRQAKLATAVSSGNSTSTWGKGAMTIVFRAPDDKIDQAEAAVLEQLTLIAEKGVTDLELQRVKRQALSNLVDSRQTVDSIAGMLARDYMMTGDVCYSENYVKKLQDVTAHQVKQAAEKYLNQDKMIITRGVNEESYSTAAAATQKADDAEAMFFTLPNGLRVILKPVSGAGNVAMALASRGGLLAEDAGCNGIGSLMAELATKGAADKSATDISSFFEQAGGDISAICGNNSFLWRANCLQDSFEPALQVFSEIITKPTFSQHELNILRPQALSRIDKADEDLRTQLNNFFRKEFFDGCPYSMPTEGCRQAVSAITAEQISQHHKRHVLGGDSVLAIYGSFDAAAARKKIEQLFASMPAGKNQAKEYATTGKAAKEALRVLPSKNVNAGVMIAVPGTLVTDVQDNVPINVLDTIISGWSTPGGWIFDELRGKQLVYAADAYNWPGLIPGAFLAYANGQPENAQQMIEVLQRNLKKATTYLPTKEEIDQAVNIILTGELLSNQSMSSLAFSAALDEMNGLGYDYRKKIEELYRKVTPEDVQRVAAKYLGQDAVIVVTTPKPELLKK